MFLDKLISKKENIRPMINRITREMTNTSIKILVKEMIIEEVLVEVIKRNRIFSREITSRTM